MHFKSNWLDEAGFETGRGVTVAQGCIVLMADNNEELELREQLYQAKQVVKGIKDVLVQWVEPKLNNKNREYEKFFPGFLLF